MGERVLAKVYDRMWRSEFSVDFLMQRCYRVILQRCSVSPHGSPSCTIVEGVFPQHLDAILFYQHSSSHGTCAIVTTKDESKLLALQLAQRLSCILQWPSPLSYQAAHAAVDEMVCGGFEMPNNIDQVEDYEQKQALKDQEMMATISVVEKIKDAILLK